jgi:predicted metal-dependent enzyme (double-stranded beta helix superfamily)
MSERAGGRRLGSALECLVAGLDRDLSLPTSEIPHAIRRRLQAALDSPDLYLDCAELLLSQLMAEPDAQFLFFDPQWRYTLQLFCWPPGFGNQPHLHENWNVSAVMTQSLLLFRSTISETDCLASTPLVVTCGQAGVLVPPQFHCLRNIGNETAITFHVFGIDERRNDKVHLERYPTSALRLDDDAILAIAREAARHGRARSINIVRAAFSGAGPATKLDLVKLMLKLDPFEAIRMGRTLSELVGGRDGRRLLEVVERLERAASQGVLESGSRDTECQKRISRKL